MKNLFFDTLGALFIVLVFFPRGLAITDALFWGYSGIPLTSIPWSEARGYFLLMWPILVFLALALLGGGL